MQTVYVVHTWKYFDCPGCAGRLNAVVTGVYTTLAKAYEKVTQLRMMSDRDAEVTAVVVEE